MHRLLVGADFQRLSDIESLGEDLADPIDIFAPSYGVAVPAPPVVSYTNQIQEQYGLYEPATTVSPQGRSPALTRAISLLEPRSTMETSSEGPLAEKRYRIG